MPRLFKRAPLLAISLLGGCVASIPPVEVTRFHLGQAIAPGAVVIEPVVVADSGSIEFRTYAAAVAKAMAGAGLIAGTDAKSPWLVKMDVTRTTRGAVRRRSPVTIGVGGGTGGYGSGVGLGASFGLGGSGGRETVITKLSVRLMNRSNRSTVWEGRAETAAPANAPAAQPGLAADKLATALFKDFPGESGKTVLVP
jgi:hypothetical protein